MSRPDTVGRRESRALGFAASYSTLVRPARHRASWYQHPAHCLSCSSRVAASGLVSVRIGQVDVHEPGLPSRSVRTLTRSPSCHRPLSSRRGCQGRACSPTGRCLRCCWRRDDVSMLLKQSGVRHGTGAHYVRWQHCITQLHRATVSTRAGRGGSYSSFEGTATLVGGSVVYRSTAMPATDLSASHGQRFLGLTDTQRSPGNSVTTEVVNQSVYSVATQAS